MVFEFRGMNLAVTVRDLEVVDLQVLKNLKGEVDPHSEHSSASANRGILMHQTSISFDKVDGSNMNLKNLKRA
jgi:hypothetical protein